MVASQDIDALLIGALYGELTPADEARLTAHLESHPTDRSALDDLTRAREAVRESRIFAVQLEPPQAISALLLQEAARRAPKKVAAAASDEQVGWFHRFTRSFMAHPAMAAAAMLVVVIGVAGTLYMRKGADAQFAEERVAAPKQELQLAAGEAKKEAEQDRFEAAPSPSFGSGSAAPHTGAAAGSGYTADLAEGTIGGADDQRYYKQKVEQQGNDKGGKAEDAKLVAKDSLARGQSQSQHAPVHADGIVVATPKTPTMAPKEMPPAKVALADPTATATTAPTDNDRAANAAPNNAPGGAGGTVGGAAPTSPTPPSNGVAYSPPPPAQAPRVQAPAPATTVQRERTVDKPAADKNDNANTDTSLVAWAKDQHARVQVYVKAGKCQDAAKIAVDISSRAPEYYAQYVASDRTIKACSAYLQSERDKEAEKSQKARAQKRVNANEPAPAVDSLK